MDFSGLLPPGARVVVDRVSGRSFTVFNGGGGGGAGLDDFGMLRSILATSNADAGLREPELVENYADEETDEEAEETENDYMNPFKRGDPATRYEVGDEVEVNLGGAPSMLPPYPGWYRGVITKRWAVPREFDTLDQLPLNKFKMPPVFPYAVRTDHGVFPALKDDPDFVRGVAAKYNTGGPLRFAVGDVVECSIGPNEWMRGTVRELHIPSRGWGRGWDFEGNRLKGVVCDTMPYHVTPAGKKFDGDYNGRTNIGVPADNDGYVRLIRRVSAPTAVENAPPA